MYNTYERAHLEYCVQVWNPYRKEDIMPREGTEKSNKDGI